METFKKDIKQISISDLKDMQTWSFDIPTVFKLAEKMTTARFSLSDAKASTIKFGSTIYKVRPKIRSMKQLTSFLEDRVERFKDWERRNGPVIYNSYFERIAKGFENAGLKKAKAKQVTKLILMSLQIENIDLPRRKTIADNLIERIRDRYFSKISGDLAHGSYRFLRGRKPSPWINKRTKVKRSGDA